jgi:hypothetical protein
MANLDTRSKRASSAALFGLLFAPVLPDGTLDQGDRQHVAFSYSGVLAAGGEPAPSGPFDMPTVPTMSTMPTIRRAL